MSMRAETGGREHIGRTEVGFLTTGNRGAVVAFGFERLVFGTCGLEATHSTCPWTW